MRFLFAIVLCSACASPSKMEEFCTRAESCNLLAGSVDECVEDLEAALDRLPPSQQDELLYEVQSCLDRPSCGGFRTCIANLRTTGGGSPHLVVEPNRR